MTFVLNFFEIIITFIDPERAGVLLHFFLVIVIELFSESLLIFSFLILLLVGPKSYEQTHTMKKKYPREKEGGNHVFSRSRSLDSQQQNPICLLIGVF